jgi:hypothetical protein
LARACGALIEIARDSIVETNPLPAAFRLTPDPMRRLAFSDVAGCVVFGGARRAYRRLLAKNAIGLNCGCASTWPPRVNGFRQVLAM